MKKDILICLCFLLLVPFAFSTSVQAAETKLTSISVPITTGLLGSNNSAKDFYLELPNGITASSIKTGTLKYTGSNGEISISLENGKIKVALKGVPNQKYISNVVGYKASWKAMYRTDIYNSIWLYSDGRRWQINQYDERNDRMVTDDKVATDGYPSKNPPRTKVTAGPYQDKEYLKWYNGSVNDVINDQDIIQSTIKVVPFEKSSYADDPKFKNGRIILNYMIPEGVPWDKESDDGLSGKAEGRKYKAFASYYYLADAKVTTYSYGGTVSFEYGLPDEATLTGSAIIEQPNPNPIKFDNKNVPVKIALKGELVSYKDTSNISEWIFYAKEKGNDSSLQTKKVYTKTLTANETFKFEIPKEKVAGKSNYSQEYELSIVVRFKNEVVTKRSKFDSLKESFTVKAGVYTTSDPPGGGFPGPTSPPELPRELKPPVALINAPKTVKAGQEFVASAAGSYDPDGYITDYFWDTPNAKGELSTLPRGTLWYDKDHLGEQTLALTVMDDDKMTGSTSTEINVIEPKPDASIRVDGTLKQNRKVIIQSYVSSPTHYPLVDAKTKITITAVSGGTNSDIKYSGSLNGVYSKDVLFKKPGKYKATIFVENTLGLTARNETTFDIAPDQKPFAYFTMAGTAYRNPSDGNQATLSIDDMSYSPDQDIVVSRLWEYRYDSDNNGSFTGEPWAIFSNENLDRLNLKVKEVGKYEVRLTVFEEFGQPTIAEFVTQADRQSIDSEATQNVIERIFTVKNQAPDVDWSW
ncbi:PKD domain-containing protein [Paenibacillus odorifer]|uniref:PKD domain-containing protein n=1 Tax=Paenibacillus odorifer TaxID=189426 RepID=UPI002DBE8A66|nr:PKD domain-containing protein [Paenibacillus odorifer]MEC0134454.1 PKD domain-containing protein [Paenibacillus odorifer]MEC0225383.1 PKD domain-containing protein [Paenibacillus odorifer]